MKKTIALVLALLLTLSLAACGGNGGGASTAAGGDPAAFTPVAGETYDTGMFTVTVPKGWLGVPVSDIFDEYEGDHDPTSVMVVKGGTEEWDTLDHAYIKITLYDKGEMTSAKDWYDDVKDMDSVTVSGFKCAAYSCTSSGYPYVMLEGSDDKHDVVISVLTKNDVNSMAYEDADVQTVLRSISVK